RQVLRLLCEVTCNAYVIRLLLFNDSPNSSMRYSRKLHMHITNLEHPNAQLGGRHPYTLQPKPLRRCNKQNISAEHSSDRNKRSNQPHIIQMGILLPSPSLTHWKVV